MKKNTYLLIASVILIGLALEFFIKFYYPQNLDGSYTTRNLEGLNILKKNSVYYDRKNKKTVKYNFGKFHNRLTGKFIIQNKILVLGDSFTFGLFVRDKNTYVNLLQEHLMDNYLINVSVPGWGTSDYVRFVENYCWKIRPGKIFVFLNTGDFTKAWSSKLYHYEINDFVNFSENNITTNKIEDTNPSSILYKIPFYKFLMHKSHLFVFIKQTIVNFKNVNFLNKKEIENQTKITMSDQSLREHYLHAATLGKMLFLRLKQFSKSDDCRNSELSVIYLGWHDYKNNSFDYNPTLYFLDEAKIFFEKNGIRYFDLTENMKEVHNNLQKYVIKNDYYPNELGHKVIADKLIEIF